MPRQSIENLQLPPQAFRVDLRTDDPSGNIEFEELPRCVEDDRRIRRALKRFVKAKKGTWQLRRATRRLLRFMDAVSAGHKRRLSAASRVQMRDWRIRVSGWLWSLIAPLEDNEWAFFTIVLPSWWVRSDDLEHETAKKLTERLRVALHRAGSNEATGWLYAMIHGEFDRDTEGFPLHVHGIATKGMINVLRGLRQQRQFKRKKGDRERYPMVSVSRKLKIDKPWGYLPKVITYASKSFWPQHNSQLGEDGKRRRIGRKQRITGKHRVCHLLWLHSQRVKDQVLLAHLSVIDGKLVCNNRG